MATYRAVMLTAKGGPETLHEVDLPLVEPGPGEVRVAVRATGAGGTDILMRRGFYPYAPRKPFVPGYEVVGVVEKLGAGVTAPPVGQRVAALVIHGGYAEKIIRHATEFVAIPDAVDDASAVALILNYVTAWQAVHRIGRVKPGDSVLVSGAAGGVGTAMLEVLRLAGIRTFAAASRTRHAFVRDLGATPVDSRTGALDAEVRRVAPEGVDVTFDNLGGAFAGQNVRATRKGGLVVGIGFAATDNGILTVPTSLARLFATAFLSGRRAKFFGITQLYRKNPEPFREDLARLFDLAGRGQLAPRIAARLPLLAARQAAEMMERGGVEGKIVHLAEQPHTAPG
jgi:NADPH:quinone reductase-like Zn-dependent oxidoreductase